MDPMFLEKISELQRICAEFKQLRMNEIDQCRSDNKPKEEYEQLESIFKALQQNTLGVQIENEKLSEDRIKEKRRAHEELNKIGSTHRICDTMLSFVEKIEEAISECLQYQAAVSNGYTKTNEQFTEMKIKYEQVIEKLHNQNNNLSNNAKMLIESSAQVMKYFEESKREYESRLSEISKELNFIMQTYISRLVIFEQKYEELLLFMNKKTKSQSDMYIKNFEELNELIQNKCLELEQIIVEMDKIILDNNKDDLFKELKERNETLNNIIVEKDEAITKYKDQIEKKDICIKKMTNDCNKSEDKCHKLIKMKEKQFEFLKTWKADYSKLETEHKEVVERAEQIELERNSAAVIIAKLTAEKEKLELEVAEKQKVIELLQVSLDPSPMEAPESMSQTFSEPFFPMFQVENDVVTVRPPSKKLKLKKVEKKN